MGDIGTVNGLTRGKKNVVLFAFRQTWCRVLQTEIGSIAYPPECLRFLGETDPYPPPDREFTDEKSDFTCMSDCVCIPVFPGLYDFVTHGMVSTWFALAVPKTGPGSDHANLHELFTDAQLL